MSERRVVRERRLVNPDDPAGSCRFSRPRWRARPISTRSTILSSTTITIRCIGNRSLGDLSNLRFILMYTPFRPLVNASYALDRWLWGYRPWVIT